MLEVNLLLNLLRQSLALSVTVHRISIRVHFTKITITFWTDNITYTLSHPKNDRDVTERAQSYRLPYASFIYASISVFLFERMWKTQVAHAITSVFLLNMRWRHGRSRGETKYSLRLSKTIDSKNSLTMAGCHFSKKDYNRANQALMSTL